MVSWLLLALCCQCSTKRPVPRSWESAFCMPDIYALVGLYEEHGLTIFKGDQKKADAHLQMVIDGFWGYFSTVQSLDGKGEAIRVLKFCVSKHGLNSALIAPVPQKLREPDIDAEIDHLLLHSRHKRSVVLRQITSSPCDFGRVERFRRGLQMAN